MPNYEGQRFLSVPWGIIEPSDLERCGPPETRLYCGTHREVVGLHIARFNGMLCVKLCDGVPESASITDQYRIVSEHFQPKNRDGDPADEAA